MDILPGLDGKLSAGVTEAACDVPFSKPKKLGCRIFLAGKEIQYLKWYQTKAFFLNGSVNRSDCSARGLIGGSDGRLEVAGGGRGGVREIAEPPLVHIDSFVV